ncbi:MAG: Na+:solute symporter [Bacteroides sp. SM23_62_1]|nr:MAG: Na+:solute symporter [Bacteroides sp. SM23_62_1]
MILRLIDWLIIASFFLLSLVIGLYASKRAGKSTAEFFLSGRNMPWWLLGISMVATTFSCDTPNLVTDLVRQSGVAGNWAWWAFLLTGMLTVFIYAKLWRRSGVMTDLEFYELRYSGKMASFLRGFRALYLGAFFNIMVIALVSLALIKIGAVMLQWPAWKTLLIASTITLIYSALGGLRGILLTDFFQFLLAMVGAIGAAIIVLKLPDVGGIHGLIHNPALHGKLGLLPDFNNREALITLLILPLAIQWWSVWYPGSEPGGGGYIAQRMLSAKNESGAVKATLLFNVAHYALRPWPWIIVALTSIIVFPDLSSLANAFPHIDKDIIRHDLAYPAMLSFLPAGFLGLVVASLVAAFMSTVSTQLNWGASYIVNDFYHRFLDRNASEKKLVIVARITTVILMILAALFTLLLSNALQAFRILLQIGAGTGLIFILRWFWWRINAFSELSAMIISFIVAVYFQIIHPLTGLPAINPSTQLVSGVVITTITWLAVTWLTPPVDMETLAGFHRLVQTGGPGWKKVILQINGEHDIMGSYGQKWDVPRGILCMVIGCFAVYAILFATGYWIYRNMIPALILSSVSIVSVFLLIKIWKR